MNFQRRKWISIGLLVVAFQQSGTSGEIVPETNNFVLMEANSCTMVVTCGQLQLKSPTNMIHCSSRLLWLRKRSVKCKETKNSRNEVVLFWWTKIKTKNWCCCRMVVPCRQLKSPIKMIQCGNPPLYDSMKGPVVILGSVVLLHALFKAEKIGSVSVYIHIWVWNPTTQWIFILWESKNHAKTRVFSMVNFYLTQRKEEQENICSFLQATFVLIADTLQALCNGRTTDNSCVGNFWAWHLLVTRHHADCPGFLQGNNSYPTMFWGQGTDDITLCVIMKAKEGLAQREAEVRDFVGGIWTSGFRSWWSYAFWRTQFGVCFAGNRVILKKRKKKTNWSSLGQNCHGPRSWTQLTTGWAFLSSRKDTEVTRRFYLRLQSRPKPWSWCLQSD